MLYCDNFFDNYILGSIENFEFCVMCSGQICFLWRDYSWCIMMDFDDQYGMYGIVYEGV